MRLRHFALALPLLAAVVTGGAACREPTQIVVSLSTNVDCSGKTSPTFEGAHVAVFQGEAVLDGSEAPLAKSACTTGALGSIAVVPGASGDEASVRIRAAARLGGVTGATAKEARDCFTTMGPDCVVSSRTLRFVRHQSLSIPIFLDSACAGKTCPAGQTCSVGGKCIGEEEPPPPPPNDGGPRDDGGVLTPLIAKAVYAGGDSTCADTGSETWCWGYGFGPTPIHVSELDGAVKIALGPTHYCAIGKGGGTLTCWGGNTHAQLGAPGGLTRNDVAYPNVNAWNDVSVGDAHSCGLAETKLGTIIVCWGDNSLGQVLGTVSKADAPPSRVTSLDIDGAKSLTSLASSATNNCVNAVQGVSSCIVTLGGCYDVICWGDNVMAQAGRGPDTDPTPRFIRFKTSSQGIQSPLTVAAGARHLLANGKGGAFGWGDSNQGQLGLAGLTVAQPVLVFSSASALVGGDTFTCGLVGDTANCVGDVPFKVTITGLTTLTAGRHHVCGLDAKGTVLCAGANDKGQLGVVNADGLVKVLH